MKKVLTLLLLFAVACGPSEQEIQSQIDAAVEEALKELTKIKDNPELSLHTI